MFGGKLFHLTERRYVLALGLLTCGVGIFTWIYFPALLESGRGSIAIAVISAFLLRFTWGEFTARYFDNRGKMIATAAIIAALITIMIYIWTDLKAQPSDFWGAVFVSWVASLIFFVLVGAVVTFATISRPEMGAFDDRARILFRKQEGEHIDYIVAKLRSTFEPHYAESSSTKFRFESVVKAEQKLLMRVEDSTVVKSYLDDIETSFEAGNKMWDVTAPPTGQHNAFLYLRTNGEIVHGPKEFNDRIEFPISTTISPRGRCLVDRSILSWMFLQREHYEHYPVRFTNTHEIVFENHLAGGEEVRVCIEHSNRSNEIVLKPGATYGPKKIANLVPGKIGFRFTVSL